MEPMDFVGLISGGKDSIYNIMEAVQAGHRLVALANLYPAAPAAPAADSDSASSSGSGSCGAARGSEEEQQPHELDSFMFQTVGFTAIEAIAECMEVPLVRRATAGASQQRELHFYGAPGGTTQHGSESAPGSSTRDEVEDLYALLADVKARFPSVKGVACGAVLSSYQRLRVESVAAALGLVPLALLWQREQGALLRDMLVDGVHAILIKVASLGLKKSMLGRPLHALYPALKEAAEVYGLNICGEGGEYESLVLDCPLFKSKRVVIKEAQTVVVDDSDPSAPVAHLRVLTAEAVEKATKRAGYPPWHCLPPAGESGAQAGSAATYPIGCEGCSCASLVRCQQLLGGSSSVGAAAAAADGGGASAPRPGSAALAFTPLIVAGLSNTSSADASGVCPLHGPTGSTAAVPSPLVAAAAEAALRRAVAALPPGCAPADVGFVHLYLADMAHFGVVNAAFEAFFGTLHPPSRSCVQLDVVRLARLAGGDNTDGTSWTPLLALDMAVAPGSGAAMRAHDFGARATLHVASLSRWAPLCIGPYCQANTFGLPGHRHRLLMPAGQIGLLPRSMTLVAPGDAVTQARQALCNLSRVLGALDSALTRALGLTLYVSAGCWGAPGGATALETVIDVACNWLAGRWGRGVKGATQLLGAGASPAVGDAAPAFGVLLPAPREPVCETFSALAAASGEDEGVAGDTGDLDEDDDASSSGVPDEPLGSCGLDDFEESRFPGTPAAHTVPQYFVVDTNGAPRCQPLAPAALKAAARGAAVASEPCDLLAPLEAHPLALGWTPDSFSRAPVSCVVPQRQHAPLHVVVVPALPRGAAVEVEAVTVGAEGGPGDMAPVEGGASAVQLAASPDMVLRHTHHFVRGAASVTSLFFGAGVDWAGVAAAAVAANVAAAGGSAAALQVRVYMAPDATSDAAFEGLTAGADFEGSLVAAGLPAPAVSRLPVRAIPLPGGAGATASVLVVASALLAPSVQCAGCV